MKETVWQTWRKEYHTELKEKDKKQERKQYLMETFLPGTQKLSRNNEFDNYVLDSSHLVENLQPYHSVE